MNKALGSGIGGKKCYLVIRSDSQRLAMFEEKVIQGRSWKKNLATNCAMLRINILISYLQCVI